MGTHSGGMEHAHWHAPRLEGGKRYKYAPPELSGAVAWSSNDKIGRVRDNPGSSAASYAPPVASSIMQLPAHSLVFLLVAMAAASSARGYSAASPVSSQQQQQQRHRMSVGHWLKSVLPPPAGDADSRNTADLDTADMIDPVLLASGFAKRQEDDYGHMRFGRSDDYGHMRFGRK
ncbi:drosulfakinin [Amblyomma americanum]